VIERERSWLYSRSVEGKFCSIGGKKISAQIRGKLLHIHGYGACVLKWFFNCLC
jgi:hypothetical protein